MTLTLDERLNHLKTHAAHSLNEIKHGLEKEALRVTPSANLAQTPHPQALGSTLCHPSITTDYSEALLEFITPVFNKAEDALTHLSHTHSFTYQNLGSELLWPHSMPCEIGSDAEIPVGYYGESNIGRMKSIYREGLAHRYEKSMQTIAGIHYNFSLPEAFWLSLQAQEGNTQSFVDFRSRGYFRLIRNFRRYSWLLMYFFGASPLTAQSFVADKPHKLDPVAKQSLGLGFATSLRMGDLGYQSDAQAELNICFNHLDSYASNLQQAVSTPYPPYEKIGCKDEQGNYLQLNCNLLQIENEYYSTIRPKRVPRSGEKPVDALLERGVEYVEVRCLDIDPFKPLGLDAAQCHFLDSFLLFCALSPSADISAEECAELEANFDATVNRGRDPELRLNHRGQSLSIADWGTQLLDEIAHCADLFDHAQGSADFAESLQPLRAMLNDPSLTPSAQIMRQICDQQQSFMEFALERAEAQRAHFLGQSLSAAELSAQQALVKQSLEDQEQIDSQDEADLDSFLQAYFEG